MSEMSSNTGYYIQAKKLKKTVINLVKTVASRSVSQNGKATAKTFYANARHSLAYSVFGSTGFAST